MDKAHQGAGGTVRVPYRGCWDKLSAGRRAVNASHVKIRALGKQAMATVKAWRLLPGSGAAPPASLESSKHASSDVIPSIPGPMPHPAPAHLPQTARETAHAVYFPACINRIFGRDPDKPNTPSLPEAFVSLSARAGKPIWIPDDVRGLCCSTPWASKGLAEGHRWMAEAVCDALWRWSRG